jgi:transglutaminase-like putative cysteine protease
LGKVLYSLRSPVLLVGDEFSDRLALDAGTEPGENLVMEVAPQGSLSGPGRFYWRARTYDTYQDGGWQYTGIAVEQFDPRQGKLTLPDYAAREAVKVKIAPNNAVQKSMFVPAHTVWVDRTTDLRVEKEAGQIVDVSAYLSNQPIFRGEVYEAEGSVAVPQADQLRAAGQDYPDWVSQKYLQLPPEVTDRTRELARRIAGDLPTAYDQAAAITAWLRSNIEYQRVIDPAPAGREKIDWFIFDYGVGFCNYYASAEVLMLRSLGVPARLAVGYARGEFDSQLALYTVTAEDYHAWPEVFFPGYGWVEFEPTVSQPVLIRPEPAPEAGEAADESLRSGFGSRGELEELRLERMTDLLNQDQVLPEQNLLDPGSTVPWGRLGLMLLAIAAIAVALWTRLDAGWRLTLNRVFSWTNRVLDRQSKEAAELDHFAMEDSDLGRAYLRWVAWWPRLGMDASRDQTPAERAVIFSRAFPELAAAGQALAQNYQLQRFNPSAAEPADWRSQWSLLQQGLWKAYFNQISGRALSWLTGGETPEHHP